MAAKNSIRILKLEQNRASYKRRKEAKKHLNGGIDEIEIDKQETLELTADEIAAKETANIGRNKKKRAYERKRCEALDEGKKTALKLRKK
jgi:hypothetical protein